jgi:hypothetical protein
MRRAVLASALAALCVASGCIESKNPPFETADLVVEPALLGDWRRPRLSVDDFDLWDLTDPKEQPLYRIQAGEGTGYREVRPGGGGREVTTEFELFKVGDHYIVTEFVTKFEGEAGVYETLKVTTNGNELVYWVALGDAILDEQPDAAKHDKDVLTGDTAGVKKFLLSAADTPGIWELARVLARDREGKVGASGLTGKKQRTLDYWFALRAGLQSGRVPSAAPGWRTSFGWGKQAAVIRRFTNPTGVDEDAAKCGPLAVEFCEAVARYAEKRRTPPDPFAATLRVTLGGAATDPAKLPPGREEIEKRFKELSEKLDATRKKLSERYGCEFPAIR